MKTRIICTAAAAVLCIFMLCGCSSLFPLREDSEVTSSDSDDEDTEDTAETEETEEIADNEDSDEDSDGDSEEDTDGDASLLSDGDTEEDDVLEPVESDESEVAGYTMTCISGVNVRTLPSTRGEIIGTLWEGDVVTVTGYESGWYEIIFEGTTAYVYEEYMGY